MTASMRAYALTAFGDEPGLTEVPVPEPGPGPGDVRIRVRAASVNPVDVATCTGAFRALYEYRFPSVQGWDLAGTVEDAGSEVTAFRPGDEVFGMVKRDYIGDGTFGEFVVVPGARQGQGAAEARLLAVEGATPPRPPSATPTSPRHPSGAPAPPTRSRRSSSPDQRRGLVHHRCRNPVDGGMTAHGGVKSISDALRAQA
jgi:hypothetical protein